MRILFLSLEFNFAPFSGNGVLARSLVASILRRKNGRKDDLKNDDNCGVNDVDEPSIQIRVICCKPHLSTPDMSPDIPLTNNWDDGSDRFRNEGAELEIWPVQLPEHCQWKRLDEAGPWKEYAEACGDGGLTFIQRVKIFRPTDVVAVDWHGMLAWDNIKRSLGNHSKEDDSRFDSEEWEPQKVAVCYYNFRVYSASSWDGNDNDFYLEKEQLSCRLADGILCLSDHDRSTLVRLMRQDPKNQKCQSTLENKINNIDIVPPPLRGDICKLASQSDKVTASHYHHHLPQEAKDAINALQIQKCQFTDHCKSTLTTQKVFITCMVRLSPEKSPHHFPLLLHKLGGIHFLRKHNLIPLLCGAKSVGSYARRVIHDVQSLCSSEESSDPIIAEDITETSPPQSSTSAQSKESWPCIIIDRFLGPNELAAVLSHTAINVHPCLYDAYGMTVVEASAFGVPSIVNMGGKVGATSLLGEDGYIPVEMNRLLDGNCIGFSQAMESESLGEVLRKKLRPREQDDKHSFNLKQIANEGRKRALAWDESAYCEGFLERLKLLHQRIMQ